MQKASGRRQESYVWEYFQYDSVTDRSTCLCEISSTSSSQSTSASRVCGKTLKEKNATNLKTHLEYFHSDAFNKVKDKEKVKNKLSNKICNASGSNQKMQSKIATFVDKINAYNENSKVYKDKLDAVVDLFAKTSLPLSLLDCPVFQQFVNTMDSQFKLPVLDLGQHLKNCQSLTEINNEPLEDSLFNFVETCSAALLKSLSSLFRYVRDATSPEFKVLPAAATLLDLRYNWTLLMPVNSAVLSMAKKYIVQKINVNRKDSNQLQIDQDLQQRPTKRFKLMTSLVLPTCSQSRTDKLLSVYSDVEEEIDRYISKVNSQLLPEDEDSIVAWSKKTDLPLLSGIAPNILALPCSQAFVERLFSTCSILTEGRQNKLSNNLVMKEENVRLANKLLGNVSWPVLTDDTSLETDYENFFLTYLNCINTACSIVSKKDRFRKP
ncbi:hypothetical protein HELRODRAFT_174239 [Helobdella robusta]|uniref:HAT C-terminal dimerisation domain-containing protein n=1 Tax=Helobdella robusta TaxID=6412 RepID=T1F7V0_HELRO|nr:hypothetical protein HELRODRAFT_174239 [Helobdella robusta]ESO02816.1 hypothetical protein HELRODRAFT_174239 [Helobdella robusta]